MKTRYFRYFVSGYFVKSCSSVSHDFQFGTKIQTQKFSKVNFRCICCELKFKIFGSKINMQLQTQDRVFILP